MCVRLTGITYYKRISPRVNTRLALLFYVYVAHTHEPNPIVVWYIRKLKTESLLSSFVVLVNCVEMVGGKNFSHVFIVALRLGDSKWSNTALYQYRIFVSI